MKRWWTDLHFVLHDGEQIDTLFYALKNRFTLCFTRWWTDEPIYTLFYTSMNRFTLCFTRWWTDLHFVLHVDEQIYTLFYTLMHSWTDLHFVLHVDEQIYTLFYTSMNRFTLCFTRRRTGGAGDRVYMCTLCCLHGTRTRADDIKTRPGMSSLRRGNSGVADLRYVSTT